MVLADLGSQLTGALRKLNSATVVDEEVVEACLKEISNALMKADVNIRYVMNMKADIKKKVMLQGDESGAGSNKRRLIQKLVMEALVSMVTADRAPYRMQKGKPNVIMFVGLQGAGKTTTCTKYAHFWARKGWKVALVCADTFRAGAFDQLKQNAAKVKIPFFGSYSDTDPVVIAEEGVAKFREEKYEIIIVDTSGRHKQEASLFEEMQQVKDAVQPNDVIFVMDSHIGQACFDQARAFSDASDVGSVIVTKLDGHAKGGGALSAVAATGAPITFLGTGEHFDEFQTFESQSFVSKLLGMGDLKGLVSTLQDVMPEEKDQERMMERMSQGQFSLRDLYEQMRTMMKMGSLTNMMSMIPGMDQSMFAGTSEEEAQKRIRRFLTIMDSCTDSELDGLRNADISKSQSRILRVARGAGVHPGHVAELLAEYKRFASMMRSSVKTGLLKAGQQQQMMRNPQEAMKKLGGALDPRLLQKMGGAGNFMNMLKSMEGMTGGGGGMPGMDGGGGMPDMGMMQEMMANMGLGGKGMGKGGGGGMGGQKVKKINVRR